MSLLTLAENDLALTLEASSDFGRTVNLTDPSGRTGTLVGQYGNITAIQDLEDEILVAGNLPHVTLRISSLRAAGFTDIRPNQDETGKPWKIQVTEENGDTKTYALQLSAPDKTLGFITGILVGAING